MKYVLLSMFCLGAFFTSCGDGDASDPSDQNGNSQTENPTDDSSISGDAPAANFVLCHEPGYSFQFTLPSGLNNSEVPTCSMNQTSGLLNIDAGEKFQLDMEEDENSLEFTRLTLEEDLVFKWEISEETQQGFIAQAKLPDGTPHYWHVFQTCGINGQKFFLRSRDGSNFTREDVLRMKEAIESVTPIH